MIITLTGMPGAGKSTTAKILAEKLFLERFYAGQIMRDCAKKKNMDLVSYLIYLETHPEEEKEYDAQVAALGEKDNIIVESRTAFHFIPNSIKIFLDVSPEEGARRIFGEMQKDNKRNEKKYSSLKEAKDNQQTRFESDRQRYRALYGFDMLDKSQYDLVIDTTNKMTDEVVQEILDYLKEKQLKK